MLSGESAVGAYPEKALAVLRQVSTRIEEWCRRASDPSMRVCICVNTGMPRAVGKNASLYAWLHAPKLAYGYSKPAAMS